MTVATEPLSDVTGYGTVASRPAAGIAGRLWFGSDTGFVYRDNGTSWVTMPAGGGAALTVEEVDGSPTDSAVTKIVVPNGSLSIVSHVATLALSSDYVKLDTQTLGADAADITFTGISAAYNDLIIIGKMRSTRAAADDTYFRVGTGSIDTASHYAYYVNYYGSGNSTVNGNSAAFMYLGATPGSPSSAGLWGQFEARLLDYASSGYQKQFYIVSSMYDNGVLTYHMEGNGAWTQTTAIDQVRIFMGTGPNIKAGSRVSIYGRK